MPISREEFDGRAIDFKVHILRILTARPDDAFTEAELLELVEAGLGLTPNPQDFAFALRHLEVAGDIEQATVNERRFWVLKLG